MKYDGVFFDAKAIVEDLDARIVAEKYGLTMGANKRYSCFKKENHRRGDKNPSLVIDKKGFHCFACGEHGNALDLIAYFEGLDIKNDYKKILAIAIDDFNLDADKYIISKTNDTIGIPDEDEMPISFKELSDIGLVSARNKYLNINDVYDDNLTKDENFSLLGELNKYLDEKYDFKKITSIKDLYLEDKDVFLELVKNKTKESYEKCYEDIEFYKNLIKKQYSLIKNLNNEQVAENYLKAKEDICKELGFTDNAQIERIRHANKNELYRLLVKREKVTDTITDEITYVENTNLLDKYNSQYNLQVKPLADKMDDDTFRDVMTFIEIKNNLKELQKIKEKIKRLDIIELKIQDIPVNVNHKNKFINATVKTKPKEKNIVSENVIIEKSKFSKFSKFNKAVVKGQ